MCRQIKFEAGLCPLGLPCCADIFPQQQSFSDSIKKDVAVGHVFFSSQLYVCGYAAQFEYRLIRRPLADTFPSNFQRRIYAMLIRLLRLPGIENRVKNRFCIALRHCAATVSSAVAGRADAINVFLIAPRRY